MNEYILQNLESLWNNISEIEFRMMKRKILPDWHGCIGQHNVSRIYSPSPTWFGLQHFLRKERNCALKPKIHNISSITGIKEKILIPKRI